MSISGNRKISSAGTVACIGAVACWTTGPIFIKILSFDLDSFTQNMLRYATACTFWLPVLIYTASKGKLNRSIWKKALIPAGINIIMQSLWAAAFYYIEPAFMNLLSKSSTIWIIVFSLIFFADERGLIRSKRFWLGVFLSITGVAGVLISKEDFTAKSTLTGIMIVLASSFTWGLYTVSLRAFLKNIDSRVGFSVISIYTVIGLSTLAFLAGKPSECLTMGMTSWFIVIFSGILSIGIAHVLYFVSIKMIGATIPAIVLLMTPFTVLAVSNIIFKESLNWQQWLFGIILLVGASLAILSQEHLRRE